MRRTIRHRHVMNTPFGETRPVYHAGATSFKGVSSSERIICSQTTLKKLFCLEWMCTTISRPVSTFLLAHCFIFNSEVSLTLDNTDQYDTLCVLQSLLGTSAAWHTNKRRSLYSRWLSRRCTASSHRRLLQPIGKVRFAVATEDAVAFVSSVFSPNSLRCL